MTLPNGISRKYILGLGDVVTVSEPEYIRLLNEHPDIGRPDQGRLPTAISALLYATQFHTSGFNNEYCVPYTTTGYGGYNARLGRTIENLKNGFTDGQFKEISQLVWSDLSNTEVATALVKLVGPTIIGLRPGITVPDRIIQLMGEMDLTMLVSSPFQYFKARSARHQIETWVKSLDQFRDEEHVIDIVHDLINVYLGFTRGLLTLRGISDHDRIESFISSHPILPVSARTPFRDTTVDGLFEGDPLRRDRTMIVLENGEAARKTGDVSFVFGMGDGERQCPFQNLFMYTCDKVLTHRPGS